MFSEEDFKSEEEEMEEDEVEVYKVRKKRKREQETSLETILEDTNVIQKSSKVIISKENLQNELKLVQNTSKQAMLVISTREESNIMTSNVNVSEKEIEKEIKNLQKDSQQPNNVKQDSGTQRKKIVDSVSKEKENLEKGLFLI
jgi:hypothetical protein